MPTLEGQARLKFRPGTQGGQRFRFVVMDCRRRAAGAGDLFVVAQIQIPKKISDREREIWSQLAELHGTA